MRSRSSLGLAIRSAVLLTLLVGAQSACVQAPPVYLNASDCRKLVPADWRRGVPSAPLPADTTVGGWVAFGDAQTGQLDLANARFSDADEIIANCENLLRKAGEESQPKSWWKFW